MRFPKFSLTKLLAGVFCLLLFASVAMSIVERVQGRVYTRNCEGVTVVINDSTSAICAKLKADGDELKALKHAAKKMNGKAVAGVQIKIKRDTVYVPTKDSPTTDSAGTRTATLRDTTDGYDITVTAEAPPVPANLKLGVKVITPERTAEVGFVKAPGGVFAVVSGKGITATTAFYSPEKEKPISVVGGVELRGAPVVGLLELRGNGYLGLDYRLSPKWSTQLRGGFDGKPFVGLVLERKLW